MKGCPRCKSLVFDDMDICYDCMYHFATEADFAELMPLSFEDIEEALLIPMPTSPDPVNQVSASTDPAHQTSVSPDSACPIPAPSDPVHPVSAETDPSLPVAGASDPSLPVSAISDSAVLESPMPLSADARDASFSLATLVVDVTQDAAGAEGRSTRFTIEQGQTIVVGRSMECDIVLDALNISRHHARLSLDRFGVLTVEDLGSVNGTYLDGLAIKGKMRLYGGDRIRIGAIIISVYEIAHGQSGFPEARKVSAISQRI